MKFITYKQMLLMETLGLMFYSTMPREVATASISRALEERKRKTKNTSVMPNPFESGYAMGAEDNTDIYETDGDWDF